MRLEYRILWFEDRRDAFEPDKEVLERELEGLGFVLKAEWVSERIDTLAELKRFEVFEPDLLLVDLHLDGQQGDDLAVMLREVFRFTDIVFYSQNHPEELRSRIARKEIDGVYCMHRRNLEIDGVEVIKMTVRKVIDLNHMRGIVMATVADFDHLLDDCFRSLHLRLSNERRPHLLEEIASKLQRDADKELKRLSRVFGEPGKRPTLDALLSDLYFTSSRKIQRFVALLKDRGFCDVQFADEILAHLTAYQAEVLGPRNQLAHAKEHRLPSGQRALMGKGGRPEEAYTDQLMLTLRKTLLKHQENLTEILDLLADGLAEFDGEGALASAFEAKGVASGKAEDPEATSAVALLGVAMVVEDVGDDLGGGGSDGAGPGDKVGGGSSGVGAVGGNADVGADAVASAVDGDAGVAKVNPRPRPSR